MSRSNRPRRRSPRVNRIIRGLDQDLRHHWEAFEALVQPPRDLKVFYRVARRLRFVVAHLPTDAKPVLVRRLNAMARAVDVVAERAFNAKLSFKGNESRSTRADVHPFYGYLTEHRAYCQLGFPPEGRLDEAADRGIARLQAHLLVLMAALGDERPSENFRSAVKRCGEAIRELQADPACGRFLRAVSGWDNRLAEFDRRFRVQLERGSYPESSKAQNGFRLLFDYLGGKALRQPHGTRRSPGIRRPPPRVEIDHDPDTGESPETQVRPTPHSRSERRRAQDSGASPGDVADRPVAARPTTGIRHGRGETPAQAAQALRRQRRAMATKNQRLPLAADRLAGPQVRALFEAMAQSFDPATDTPGGLEHQLRVLVELVFWTGSTVDEVLAAHVAPGLDHLPNPTDRHLVPRHGCWLVPAPPLDHQARAKDEWAGDMRRPVRYVALPLPRQVLRLVEPLLPGRGTTGRRLLFRRTGDHDRLRERLSQRLAALNQAHPGTRVTPLRLALHRLYALYDGTGDLAEAALITGRSQSVGLDSPLYYNAPWLRDLARRYRDACRRDLERLELGSAQGPDPKTIKALPSRVTAGVEVCPRRAAVRDLAQGLAEQVAAARVHIDSDIRALCRWHNRLSAYVVALVLWTTGHRVVGGPVCDHAHIVSEYLLIDDKQGAILGDPRLAWLPALVREQLEAYDRHARVVLGRLLGHKPEALRHRRYDLDPEDLLPTPFVFTLRHTEPREDSKHPSVEIQAVEPRRYSSLLWRVARWPANVHRHYLRTHLREAGVNGEVVDAFMGHGLIGCEPLGRHSSLGPATIAAATGPVIESLLADAGWTVLPGLGA